MAKDNAPPVNSKPTAGANNFEDIKELWTVSNIVEKGKSAAWSGIKYVSSKASDHWKMWEVQPASQENKNSSSSTWWTSSSSSSDQSEVYGKPQRSTIFKGVTSSLYTISEVFGKAQKSTFNKEIPSSYPSDQKMENVRPAGETSSSKQWFFKKLFKN